MKKPVLVLSFDINKTLIMRDGGVPVPSMINSLLSETTWGLVKPSVEGGLNELSMCEGDPASTPFNCLKVRRNTVHKTS